MCEPAFLTAHTTVSSTIARAISSQVVTPKTPMLKYAKVQINQRPLEAKTILVCINDELFTKLHFMLQ